MEYNEHEEIKLLKSAHLKWSVADQTSKLHTKKKRELKKNDTRVREEAKSRKKEMNQKCRRFLFPFIHFQRKKKAPTKKEINL